MSEHTVTATEPAWVQAEYRPDGDMPEYVADSTRIEESIDMLQDEADYSCECGAELNSWFDVMEHYEEVAGDE